MGYTRIIVVCALTVLAQVRSEVIFRGSSNDGNSFAEVRRLESPGGDTKTVTTITSHRMLGSPQLVKSQVSASGSSPLLANEFLANRFLGYDGGLGSVGNLGALQFKPVFNPFLQQQYSPFPGQFSAFGVPGFQQLPAVPQVAQISVGGLPSASDIAASSNPYFASSFNYQDPLSVLSPRALLTAQALDDKKETHQ